MNQPMRPVQPRQLTQNEQTLIELGKLALKVGNNPETRPEFIKAVKKVSPGARFPVDETNDRITALEQQLADEKLRVQQAAVIANQEKQKSGLATKFSPEQIVEIESIMTKYGLSDYDAAAKIYGADFKPAKPSGREASRHGSTWEFPELPGLFDNPEKAARDAAYAVIDELRGRA